jgi:hypothetical protein
MVTINYKFPQEQNALRNDENSDISFLTVKSAAAITLNVVSIKTVKENFVIVQVQMAWFQRDSISVTIQIEISRT